MKGHEARKLRDDATPKSYLDKAIRDLAQSGESWLDICPVRYLNLRVFSGLSEEQWLQLFKWYGDDGFKITSTTDLGHDFWHTRFIISWE